LFVFLKIFHYSLRLNAEFSNGAFIFLVSSCSRVKGLLKARMSSLAVSWKPYLEEEFTKPYMVTLKSFLKAELTAGRLIYPEKSKWFAAFAQTPFEKVRVVILGQDPYHGPGQAHGLCFSVPIGVRPPPSLLNIFKEMHADLGIAKPQHGNLTWWSDQGVLLLNSVLTVEKDKAGAHQSKGWEQFTDRVIHALNDHREHIVFVLWGAYAQKKGQFIDRKRHLVLESVHPSPLSASRGFLGSRPFSKIDQYLVKHGEKPIQWALPPL
jgi:uracil-DNA glycosylase